MSVNVKFTYLYDHLFMDGWMKMGEEEKSWKSNVKCFRAANLLVFKK